MTNNLWDERNQAFTAALKSLRKSKKITQIDLAALLNKPQSFVSKYENGERTLDFIEILDICDALATPLPELVVLYEKKLAS